MDSWKESATGWLGTSMPTASISTMPLTRGDSRKAISAVIHPPTELPITVTSSSPELLDQSGVELGHLGDSGEGGRAAGAAEAWVGWHQDAHAVGIRAFRR